MEKLMKRLLRVLVVLFLIAIQPANAQQNGFITCIDDSGNASLCVGEIPESEIQKTDKSSVTNERGCGYGSSNGALSWSQNDSDELAGIYWAFLKTYCRNNRSVVIWTDLKGGFFNQRTGGPFSQGCGRPYSSVPRDEDWGINGEFENDPCISFDFSLFRSGEGSGDINGIEFNLNDGDVFLVSTAGGEVTVRQIDYDLTFVSAEDIKLLARKYPEIRSFFEEQAF